jgi:protein-S-isoprenylcysteine O-methyltransferase Ste14
MGSLASFAGPLAFFGAARFWYIPYEEARMKDKYGTRYDDYCRRVPRWLALRAKVQRHSAE